MQRLRGESAIVNLVGMSREELRLIVERLGERDYRAGQIMSWLYAQGAESLEAMTNLPASLRSALAAEGYGVFLPEAVGQKGAADGTIKYLFRLNDGRTVESVYIPEGPRRTACLSTQVGCGMGCAFCATAQAGLLRNLDAGEIVGQVLRIRRLIGARLTNIVAMGQGEPLANYRATAAAFRLLGAAEGLGIAARHLAISTCGLPEGILRLAGEGRQWQLTVSLHAARDDLRSRLMPINRLHPLADLKRACAEYCRLTGRRITFAYVLIAGLNDSRRDAKETAAFCRGLLAHVNLIPWNPVAGVDLAPSTAAASFRRWLAEEGINATIRRTRGAEYDAACGQLRPEPLEVRE